VRRGVILLASMLLAGCDLVFGLHRDLDAIDAQVEPPPPACWSDPDFFGLGTLPSAKYWLGDLAEPWHAAEARCEAKGDAHLVVTSRLDAEWGSLLATALTSDYWIGISDELAEGNYVAVTGESVGRAQPPWRPGEPTGGRSENCVAFNFDGLNDLGCDASQRTLCECELPVTYQPSTGDPAYEVVTGPFTFVDADAACRERGKQLVRIDSDVEQLTLETQFANKRLWIDATDLAAEGDWRAGTGCRPDLRWKSGTSVQEPDGGTIENCAALLIDGLADAPCGRALDALCEAP